MQAITVTDPAATTETWPSVNRSSSTVPPAASDRSPSSWRTEPERM
jgi:hypothetical protein